MKVTLTLPDDISVKVDDFVGRNKIARSALFAAAIEEYIDRHQTNDITSILNEVYSAEDSSVDPVLNNLQMLSLSKEW